MKKIVSTRQLILDTLVSNLEHLYTMHERVVPTLPIDEYNDQLLAGIKEAKDTLGNTAQFLQELLDDLNRGIYWYLPKLYVLEKYLSFRHVKPHALDDEVTEELQCSLRRILLEIEGQISHIRTACKWYKNNSDVINHFLPEMDCGKSVQNEIEQHNRKDLRVKRLEELCTGFLNEIKKDKFLSEVSKTEIIVKEAELEGVEPEEAAFRHYFISDEDGGLTADREELMSYYIEYGASPETIWYQYQWYKSARKLLKEIEGQKLTEDKKEKFEKWLNANIAQADGASAAPTEEKNAGTNLVVDAIREQTEVLKQTAAAMLKVAAKPTSIGQLNMGNGEQTLPPSTNIPLIQEQ